MGSRQAIARVTLAEYLRREIDAVDTHEYYFGEVFLMPGGSPNHSLINANAAGAMGNALRKQACRVYDSNLRIRVQAPMRYTYPDASIICGEPCLDPDDKYHHTVLNPTLLVEVLSPDTEAYDRGAKFASYMQIDSFREYVLISQDAPRVETFLRQTGGAWRYLSWAGIETTARLESINVPLRLADVYDGVTFSEAAPARDMAPEP